MRRFFRPSLHQKLTENARASAFYASTSEKPLSADALRATVGPAPKKLHRDEGTFGDALDIDAVHRKQPAPLEKHILKACLDALRLHPKVAFVGRFNRGVMQSTYNGRDSYTSFNSVPGFPDIHGMLKGGAAFYIEVKRPHTGKLDDRQSHFLAIIRANGGIAGVATSVEEALALISPALPPVSR